MKPKTGERAALVLLIAYCLDLAWKLAHWSELTKGLDWWMIAMALTIRFAVMGGLLFLFIRMRRAHKSATTSEISN
jgi:heme/copper-type cytochrome/quinol oxidase subunit 2